MENLFYFLFCVGYNLLLTLSFHVTFIHVKQRIVVFLANIVVSLRSSLYVSVKENVKLVRNVFFPKKMYYYTI